MKRTSVLIEKNTQPFVDELLNLFSQAAWAWGRSKDKVEQMLKRDDLVVCLRESGKLVGYGRIITDGCFRGLLDDVIIDEGYRGKGYGKLLVESLLSLAQNIDEIFLNANESLLKFYLKYGFERFNGLTMLKKNKP